VVELERAGRQRAVRRELTADEYYAGGLAGDELQGIKRGLLELVDVIAVNKADGPTRQATPVPPRSAA
jgi:methylmalonyl-CoA mutase-associated GTPase MeaB